MTPNERLAWALTNIRNHTGNVSFNSDDYATKEIAQALAAIGEALGAMMEKIDDTKEPSDDA